MGAATNDSGRREREGLEGLRQRLAGAGRRSRGFLRHNQSGLGRGPRFRIFERGNCWIDSGARWVIGPPRLARSPLNDDRLLLSFSPLAVDLAPESFS